MYQKHWALREAPFPQHRDLRFFHQGPPQEEALARLRFLTDGRRLGLLLGEAGCGKSLLLEVFCSELRRRDCQTALISLYGLDSRAFLWLLASTWCIPAEPHASTFELWLAVRDRLCEHRLQSLSTVLLLDDADEASPEVLETIYRLTQGESSTSSNLTLVVAGRSTNGRSPRSRFWELAELRIDLECWDLDETNRYLHESLAKAGRTKSAFQPDAVVRLYELSGGRPRKLNQLADLALLAAAGQGLPLVDSHTVDAVCEELSLGGSLAAHQ
jgi:type II secretory pathway predicted ATPase ExeA